MTKRLKPLVKSAARKVIHRLKPWLPPPEPQPVAPAAPDPTSAVWTLPDRPLREALPPVAELLRTQHGEQPVSQVLRGLFGDDGTIQTKLLHALSEEKLQTFVSTDTAPLPRTEDRAHYFGEQHVSY